MKETRGKIEKVDEGKVWEKGKRKKWTWDMGHGTYSMPFNFRFNLFLPLPLSSRFIPFIPLSPLWRLLAFNPSGFIC